MNTRKTTDNTIRTTLNIDKDVYEYIESYCTKNGITKTEALSQVVSFHEKEYKKIKFSNTVKECLNNVLSRFSNYNPHIMTKVKRTVSTGIRYNDGIGEIEERYIIEGTIMSLLKEINTSFGMVTFEVERYDNSKYIYLHIALPKTVEDIVNEYNAESGFGNMCSKMLERQIIGYKKRTNTELSTYRIARYALDKYLNKDIIDYMNQYLEVRELFSDNPPSKASKKLSTSIQAPDVVSNQELLQALCDSCFKDVDYKLKVSDVVLTNDGNFWNLTVWVVI